MEKVENPQSTDKQYANEKAIKFTFTRMVEWKTFKLTEKNVPCFFDVEISLRKNIIQTFPGASTENSRQVTVRATCDNAMAMSGAELSVGTLKMVKSYFDSNSAQKSEAQISTVAKKIKKIHEISISLSKRLKCSCAAAEKNFLIFEWSVKR